METAPLSFRFLRPSLPLFPQLLHPFRRFNPLLCRDHSFSCPRCRNRKAVFFACSVSASPAPIPSSYGGWDDAELLDESYRSGTLDSIRSFLASLGITDGKHGFLFLLGFLSALAVSRVRVSSMAVLPVSVVVFVVGFSAGVAQAGVASGSIWDLDDKLKDLRDLLKELDDKMSGLRSGLEGGVKSNRLEKSKLKNFVEVVEHMRLRMGHAQMTIESFSSGDIVDSQMDSEQGGKKSSHKPSRKRRELGMIAYDLVQLLGSLFQENITGLKPLKGKDAVSKVEFRAQAECTKEDIALSILKASPEISENGVNRSSNKKLDGSKVEKKSELSLVGAERVASEMLKVNIMADQNSRSGITPKKFNHSGDQRYGNCMPSHDEELNNLNTSFHFMTKQERYQKMVFRHKYRNIMENEMHNSADGSANQKEIQSMDFFNESIESSLLEQMLEVHDQSSLHALEQNSNKIKNKLENGSDFIDQSDNSCNDLEVKFDDQSVQHPTDGVREGKTMSSSSSSSMVTTDEEFNQNVKEASELQRKARVYMKSQTDEAATDALLYRSAILLSTAVALKPMSLLAIGQLGNTYLLHGELKLKISRELRVLLSKSDAILKQKLCSLRLKKLDIHNMSRENVAAVLIDVCEECEELLVEAGRKYRMALSIDRSDVRALYNWGLALSYRAQLIADIGPVSINLTLSRRNKNAVLHAALYRWGIVLQQRSNLRRNNRGEKLKLLQQAKSLFEDVLYVESDNRLAREALSSCLLELNHHGQW
ncbi:hypothetical protein BHE74_00021213 [Ensete ventricosum]|nr:hypothetical protein BHE74_00021213 [Ensete ventricosum]RZR91012.1 hypothetical protein BHM03_00019046 [Ensete ventricosum]